jgi:hypothetical protein
MATEGYGSSSIASKFTKEKLPSFGDSGKWTTAYVRLMITDRRAIGEYQPKKLEHGSVN